MVKLDMKREIIKLVSNLPVPMYKKIRAKLVSSDRNWLVGQSDLRRFSSKKMYLRDVKSSTIV